MATKSIGATGRDYATLALWAAYVNALTLSAPEVGEMYNDAEFAISAAVTIGGWTGGSATNTVTLRAAAGQSYKDDADKLTNALRYNQSNGVGIRSTASYDNGVNLTSSYTIVDGIQFFMDSTTGQYLVNSTGGNATITNCIIQGRTDRSEAALILVGSGSEASNLAVIIRGNGRGVHLSSGSPTIRNSTIVSSNSSTRIGVWSEYSGGVAINVAVAGFTDNFFGTAGVSSSNNATSAGSFGGTNWGGSGQTSLVGTTEWESVTLNSEDLRVKSTSAKLKDNGATSGPTTDIVGQTRPAGSAYDIGCWELDQGFLLLPALFTNTQTFHTATLTAVYSPPYTANAPKRWFSHNFIVEAFFHRFITLAGWFDKEGTSGATTPNLLAPVFVNSQTFHQPTVTRGAVALTASLFSDPDTVPAHSLSSIYTLTPSLFANSNTINSQTVTRGAVALTASLFVDQDTIPSHTVSPGAVALTASLFSDPDTVPAHSIAATYALTAAAFVNTNSIYSHTVSPGAVNLSASLFSDPDSIYSHTVSVGAVSLGPSTVIDADSFYTHTLAITGVNLSPSLFADPDTVHSATVTVGAVDLLPTVVVNSSVFPTHTIASGAISLSPALYVDSDSIYSPTVAPGAVGLVASLISDPDSIYAHSLSVGAVTLTPSTVIDADTIHSATLTTGAVNLSASLFTDPDNVYSHTIEIGVSNLSPSLFSDGDTFYTHSVSVGAVTLLPALHIDPDTVLAATVTPGAVTIVPALFVNGNQHWGPSITSNKNLVPSIYVNASNVSLLHSLFAGPVNLSPQLYAPSNQFFNHALTTGAVAIFVPLTINLSGYHAPVVVGLDQYIWDPSRITVSPGTASTVTVSASSRARITEGDGNPSKVTRGTSRDRITPGQPLPSRTV